MRDHHLAIFDFVRKAFSRPKCKPEEIVREIQGRVKNKFNDWYLFDERIGLGSDNKIALGNAFRDYCEKLVACICDASVGSHTITYYETLMAHLQR